MKLLCECQLKKSKIVLFWTLVKHLILCGLVNISLYISGIEIKWGYFVVLWLCHFGNFSPLHTCSNSFWKCWFARADFISNSKVPPARQKLETLPLDRVLWQYGLWSFQTGGTKLERFLPKNQHTYWILRIGLMGRCQKVPKFDFQSQFSMSKIIRIILNFLGNS